MTRRTIRSNHLANKGMKLAMGMQRSVTEAQAKAMKGKSWLKCRPVGIGSVAGQNVMHNDAFQSLVETSDKWITKRTGISNRHIIEKGSTLRDIGVKSAQQALRSSGTDAKDIDLVIVATSTPDDLFGDAGAIAASIGATNAAAFDITAACSGFVYGLVTASQFLNSGAYKKVLVVGADALTRFLNWDDRGTCILFGDGSGATVLEATERRMTQVSLDLPCIVMGVGLRISVWPFTAISRSWPTMIGIL